MITFRIDEFTPCLKDSKSGEIYETEVVRIKRKSFLSKFNKKTGWYVNWGDLVHNFEIYALVLKGTMDIQGLIAIQYDNNAQAVKVHWGCTAPHNNVFANKEQKFVGVGGHLFAIASDLSVKKGYDGFVYGEAVDAELFNYYIECFGAVPLPSLKTENPFRFMLSDETTKKIREVYSYEWTEENI